MGDRRPIVLRAGEGEAADNIVGGPEHSTLANDAFPSREFDFMLSNPPYGKSWKTDLERMGELRSLIEDAFRSRTMKEWAEVFDGTDACVAPILTPVEAAEHPHNVARGVYVEKDGLTQPAPAPRFSRTSATLDLPPAPAPGAHTREALAAWGIGDVDALIESGAAVQAE